MSKTRSPQEGGRIQIQQTILQHAENLFKQRGYANTSMDALSASCEYTKRTIYRYFTCKEDLYFAVLLKGHTRLLEMIKAELSKGSTGYEKIEGSYRAFHDFFIEDPSQFDLMAQIKAIKSEKNSDVLPYFQKYTVCVDTIYRETVALFMMANKDKSIRTDVDASLLGFSSAFILQGFYHMLSLMGDSFTDHFSLSREEFIQFTIERLFQILGGERGRG